MEGACVGALAVRGLQVLGPACTRQLLVTGLDMCNAAAAAPAARHSPSSQADLEVASFCHHALAVLNVLCELPAAQQLPAAAVQQLLPALTTLVCKQVHLLGQGLQLLSSGRRREGSKFNDWPDELCALDEQLLLCQKLDIMKNMLACGKLLQQLRILPAVEQMPLESGLFQPQIKTYIIDTKEQLVGHMAVLRGRGRQAWQAQVPVQLAEELLAKLQSLEDSPLYGVAASAGS
ncbi:hypothetical protein OEZ85_009172 [Tetradesmus obliquus]|uniref:Uncharacterized protein n=1 Tax=Tetradesmus obliquus TaxID=3088 RepID=A0ABY8TN17_TETOB|nr:hypothetical protein OEZ85_009172 [Tetradesmus obliquus]